MTGKTRNHHPLAWIFLLVWGLSGGGGTTVQLIKAQMSRPGAPGPEAPGGPPASNASLNPDSTCRLLTLLPFAASVSPIFEYEPLFESHQAYKTHFLQATSRHAYSLMAMAQLAINHFNARNPVLVPELADLALTCPPQVQISTQLVKAASRHGNGIVVLFESQSFLQNLSFPTVVVSNWSVPLDMEPMALPCAILGPNAERENQDMTYAIGSLQISQVTRQTLPSFLTAIKDRLLVLYRAY